MREQSKLEQKISILAVVVKQKIIANSEEKSGNFENPIQEVHKYEF